MNTEKSYKKPSDKFIKNQDYLKTGLFEFIQVKSNFTDYLPKNVFYEKSFENVMEIEIESDNGGDEEERHNKSYENPKGKNFSGNITPIKEDQDHDQHKDDSRVEINDELFSFEVDEDDFLKTKSKD